jgi:hypothetical protein
MKDLISRLLDSIAYAPAITISLIFEPRDLWVGVFFDTKKRTIYILPVPTAGLKISWTWEEV